MNDQCRAMKVSGNGSRCKKKGHPEYEGFCLMHYRLWLKGKIEEYEDDALESAPQFQNINPTDEATIKKAFEIYKDHKKYVYDVKNDPAYHNTMDQLNAVKQYTTNLINNSPNKLKQIIQKYTDGKYHGVPFHDALNKYIENPHPYSNTLDEAYEALNGLTHKINLPAMVLWKGFKRFENMDEIFKKGNISIQNRLYSTSYDERTVLHSYFTNLTCCVFQIYFPKDAHGLPLESISGYDEKEILLPARLKTVIVDKFDKNIDGRTITYYVGIFMY